MDSRRLGLKAARRVVLKLGTQLLTGADGHLDIAYIRDIATQITELRQRGVQVTLVSSGAIGSGCAELGMAKRPRDLAGQQAVAAVGQRRLMTYYHDAFEKHGLNVAQLLLTRDDFDNRVRFLNIRNCVSRLHDMGCIPIINENDTVAVDELRFGENDLLAALTCNALRGDALVLMTVVDGLLDAEGRKIDVVESVKQVMSLVRTDKSTLGSGGMATKLAGARLVTEAGEAALIVNGRTPNVLARLFSGEDGIGTLFLPAARKLDSRERWIALTKRPKGTLHVDAGCAKALRECKSLLPIGITAVVGDFEEGSLLQICDPDGQPIARGLTNYAAEALQAIMGKKSNQLEKILGRPAHAEVIHRDNLVVTEH